MARYPFPNVPQAPGVPQVVRSPAFPNTTPPVLGTALALGRLVLALTRDSGWGIYLDSSLDPPERDPATGEVVQVLTVSAAPPVLVPDSFMDFGYRQEWAVTTAPTELGGFAAYNKVNNPFEAQVRVTKGGSLRARTEFLQKLDEIARSLKLYKIVTPEKVYFGCNISRYEVTRKGAGGAYFLAEVDIFFTEIRVVTSEYTNTTFNTQVAKEASAEPIKNYGTKQAIAQ
jgi:hypothetical protein